MKRRLFLYAGAGTASTMLLSQCTRPSSPEAQSPVDSTLSASDTAASITQSAIHTSANGLLAVDLEASLQTMTLDGKPAKLMVYNGQMPGPRLEAKPGDTVRIRLTNNLSDPTNIHYHGLQIPHTGNGDNVFLDIQPGETFTYEFTLPDDHPVGTFWYHPHRHGFVADQVFAGLSGFFIVRGELDDIPAVKAAAEIFLALKDFQLDDQGNVAKPDRMAAMMGREGALVTASGEVNPSLTLPQNGLLRLRILNASISRFYRLQLEQHSMHLIATDGGALSEPVELEELLLSPGERADILVRGDQAAESYRLLNLPYDRGGMGMMGGMHMNGNGLMDGMHRQEGSSGPMTIATVTYSIPGLLTTPALPAQLIPVEALPAATNTRRIELSMEMSFLRGMAFTLNGKTFDPDRVDVQVPINTVEEWDLANVDEDLMDHPFHLHIGPFQVVSRNGQPEPYPAWKDTVLVKGGETVRIRIPFGSIPGKTVYHCHVLDHEELGMMGVVEVQ